MFVDSFLHHLEQTDAKFNKSLDPGEGLRAHTARRMSEWSHNRAVCCAVVIVWHMSTAYFSITLFQIIDLGISAVKHQD